MNFFEEVSESAARPELVEGFLVAAPRQKKIFFPAHLDPSTSSGCADYGFAINLLGEVYREPVERTSSGCADLVSGLCSLSFCDRERAV